VIEPDLAVGTIRVIRPRKQKVMAANTDCFDVFPKVLRAGRKTTVTIRPLTDRCCFRKDISHKIVISAMDDSAVSGKTSIEVLPTDGLLRIGHVFQGEQEHILSISVPGTDPEPIATFHLYSVADDLFDRQPYKGDLHMHSNQSDGKESPAYVAGACRRIGLDFMAVTDHGKYKPSLEAIKAYENTASDLRIFPGEEVHPPGNKVHIVNFGGNSSVNDLCADTENYNKQVRSIESKLGQLVPGVAPFEYASCLWVFEKIREAGGMGIFCHPYWIHGMQYVINEAIITQILNDRPYDALELIGGYHLNESESNSLQVARYHEERAKGGKIPIVGSSDSHGCESGALFGWYYTVVFAHSTDLPDLAAGIKGLWSVAVESLPGQKVHVHGPFRIVRFALFLIREVFPAHDRMCKDEGAAMLAHIAGENQALDRLRSLKGQTSAYLERMWGKQ
jgi:hypothetical protein